VACPGTFWSCAPKSVDAAAAVQVSEVGGVLPLRSQSVPPAQSPGRGHAEALEQFQVGAATSRDRCCSATHGPARTTPQPTTQNNSVVRLWTAWMAVFAQQSTDEELRAGMSAQFSLTAISAERCVLCSSAVPTRQLPS
jgi:hypothetical protein